MDMNINSYVFVISSKQRREIVAAMAGTITPTQIYKKVKEFDNKITFNNVSDILRLLKRKGIVVCINEEQKKGRLYKLTADGKSIREQMLKIGIH